MEVGILVLTNFTYTYGSTISAKQCGQWLTFNPSSPEQLEELKFILDSSYMKRGFLYVENIIKEDFKNREGIFSNSAKVDNTEQLPESTVEIEVVTSEVKLVEEPSKLSKEDRQVELNALSVIDLKRLAEQLSVEYSNKVKTIEAILKVEYP